MAMASASPSTNEMTSAASTRAKVTATSIQVTVARLCAMRVRLGTANGGMPMSGARCDSASQASARIAMVTSDWRGKPGTKIDSRLSSRDIDDLLVRHFLVEAGFDRALHHVPYRLAVGSPGRAHVEIPALAGDRGFEHARRQLHGRIGERIGRIGLVANERGDVLQRRHH